MNHLNDTIDVLQDSISRETIIHYNNYAAAALEAAGHKSGDNFIFEHNSSQTEEVFSYDTDFPRNLMKERNDLAEFGALALCFYQMSILLDYRYVELSAIGTGVDYFFSKDDDDDDENFYVQGLYVEVSGISSPKENLQKRISDKKKQVKKGSINSPNSAVCITSFPELKTVNEMRNES